MRPAMVYVTPLAALPTTMELIRLTTRKFHTKSVMHSLFSLAFLCRSFKYWIVFKSIRCFSNIMKKTDQDKN